MKSFKCFLLLCSSIIILGCSKNPVSTGHQVSYLNIQEKISDWLKRNIPADRPIKKHTSIDEHGINDTMSLDWEKELDFFKDITISPTDWTNAYAISHPTDEVLSDTLKKILFIEALDEKQSPQKVRLALDKKNGNILELMAVVKTETLFRNTEKEIIIDEKGYHYFMKDKIIFFDLKKVKVDCLF